MIICVGFQTDLEALQPADVHHVVGLVGDDGHDLEGHLQRLGLLEQVGPLGVFEDGLQQHVVLGQPLDGLDQQVSQPQLETVLQPDLLQCKVSVHPE